MRGTRRFQRGGGLAAAMTLAVLLSSVAAEEQAAPSDDPDTTSTAHSERSADPLKEVFRGQVVSLRQALKKRDIVVGDEMDSQVVLETAEGELIPILADWRGRAFYQDERLRQRDVELVGFRRDRLPYLQVLMVFTFDEEGQRRYTDYWCDVCSIPMYEIKPCECCQGPVRLRFQPQDLPDYLTSEGQSSASP